MAAAAPAFAGLNYPALAETAEQWPLVGREDVYYGGTSYENRQGLGQTLSLAAAKAAPVMQSAPAAVAAAQGSLLLLPVTRLLDQARGDCALCLVGKTPGASQPAAQPGYGRSIRPDRRRHGCPLGWRMDADGAGAR